MESIRILVSLTDVAESAKTWIFNDMTSLAMDVYRRLLR
jgi:hypothetical protein